MATRHEAYPGVAYAGVHAAGGLEGGKATLEAQAFEFMRKGFVKKVFGILAAQLLLTAVIAAPIVLHGPTRAFVSTNPWVVTLSSFAALGLVLVLSFSESARHSHPTNLILLGAFTALEGVAVGAVSAQYALSSVALAVAVTAGVAGSLAAYAARTKTDYTARGGMLLSALTALILTGFLALFTRSSAAELMISGVGALIFGAYIVFDIQLLIGGQGRFQLSPDDYVAGAIALYLDIINLFLHILRLLGSERD